MADFIDLTEARLIHSGGGGDWQEIGVCETTEFIDARAPLVVGQPEVRRYRLRYEIADVPVGGYSGVFQVTTIP